MTQYILLNKFFRRDWIFDSQLSAVALAFEDYLRERKYSERTIRSYLNALAHFAHWIKPRHLDLAEIDEQICRRFVERHLPRCRCPRPRLRVSEEVRPTLMHLRAVLLEQGYGVQDSLREPFFDELHGFQNYLTLTCGIAPGTCKQRLKIIRPFLQDCFADHAIDLSQVTTNDLDNFILGFAKRRKPASLGAVRSSIRSYLRYRALRGDQTESLGASLPVIANWKSSSLPKTLTDGQIKMILDGFNQADPIEMRDYAIARCLVDLGLRGHEIADLELDSVNWREGTITIRTNKGRQAKQLPLPSRTGAAIVKYLKTARIKTSSRALFLPAKRNQEKSLTIYGIRAAMRRAFIRCGLGDQYAGIHVFRHTLAERLQRSGSSLKEIADVLRHNSLESTAIYAKVDLQSLRLVALPWPGRQL
jgi:site-specific recombinase XerD